MLNLYIKIFLYILRNLILCFMITRLFCFQPLNNDSKRIFASLKSLWNDFKNMQYYKFPNSCNTLKIILSLYKSMGIDYRFIEHERRIVFIYLKRQRYTKIWENRWNVISGIRLEEPILNKVKFEYFIL